MAPHVPVTSPCAPHEPSSVAISTRRATRSNKSLRFRLPDGATLAVWFEPKAEDRTAVSVQIDGFESRTLVDAAKERWAQRLEVLRGMLG